MPDDAEVLGAKAERVRAEGKRILNSLELDRVIRNLGEIMSRIKKLSPSAHDTVLKNAFGNNRSTLSKYTNPNAQDCRTKFSSYLTKAGKVSNYLAWHKDVDYPPDKLVLDLVRGTGIAEEVEYSSSSSRDRALDDLWNVLQQTGEYIDRKTNLYEQLDFLRGRFHWHISGSPSGPTLKSGLGEDGSPGYQGELWPRVPFCEIAYSFDVDLKYVAAENFVVSAQNQPWAIYDESDLIEISSKASISEKISLVARPEFEMRRLGFALETKYQTSLSYSGTGPVPSNTMWEGKLSLGQNRAVCSTDEILINDGKGRPRFAARVIFNTADVEGDFLSGPLEESDEPIMINRGNLEAWTDIYVEGGDGLWMDFSAGSSIPSELGFGTLTNSFEYVFQDTASQKNPWERDMFITPAILKSALSCASKVNDFKRYLLKDRRESQDRLARIFSGEETLN
jgi:hypothetical protein